MNTLNIQAFKTSNFTNDEKKHHNICLWYASDAMGIYGDKPISTKPTYKISFPLQVNVYNELRNAKWCCEDYRRDMIITYLLHPNNKHVNLYIYERYNEQILFMNFL
jgi:hypothetical protein